MKRDLLSLIKRRKPSYFGHVMREGDCLEKEITQDSAPGERKQGRPKMRWIDDMGKYAEMSFGKLLRETGIIWKWNRLVHEAINPRNEDG